MGSIIPFVGIIGSFSFYTEEQDSSNQKKKKISKGKVVLKYMAENYSIEHADLQITR